MALKGMVAKIRKVGRFWIMGFAAETARTTSSMETPMHSGTASVVVTAGGDGKSSHNTLPVHGVR